MLTSQIRYRNRHSPASISKYSLSRQPTSCYLPLDMISSIAAKRITSSMPSPSITSTTTTSTITATGEWRN
jgi:hypothetical protein